MSWFRLNGERPALSPRSADNGVFVAVAEPNSDRLSALPMKQGFDPSQVADKYGSRSVGGQSAQPLRLISVPRVKP